MGRNAKKMHNSDQQVVVSETIVTIRRHIVRPTMKTNTKSHTGFQLVSVSMTLNVIEQRNATPYPMYSMFSGARCVELNKDRPILSEAKR